MTHALRFALLVCLLSAACTKGPSAPSEIAAPSQTPVTGEPVITSELAGVVTETPPTGTTPIAGAVVEVVTGQYAGRKTATDASGGYVLTGVAGDLDVTVSLEGYETQRARVSVIKSGSRLDVALLPDAEPVRTTFSGGLCADQDAYPAGRSLRPCEGAPAQVHHFFPIHRAGTLEVELSWLYRQDYSPEYMWLELECGADKRTEQVFVLFVYPWSPLSRAHPGMVWWTGDERLKVSVSRPGICEVELNRYDSFKGIVAKTNYQIDIIRPK